MVGLRAGSGHDSFGKRAESEPDRGPEDQLVDDRVEPELEQDVSGEAWVDDRSLGVAYPDGLFSLSHVALPFPMSDSLYGLTPDSAEDFGIHLGSLAPRGERNVLIASLDSLLRASSNPFFPYMIERIDEGIEDRNPTAKKADAHSLPPPSNETDNEVPHPSIREIISSILGFAPRPSESTSDEP